MFKEGDKVICINNRHCSSYLKENKVYIVECCKKSVVHNKSVVKLNKSVVKLLGTYGLWYEERFVCIETGYTSLKDML